MSNGFEKFFHEYHQSDKQLGSRFCRPNLDPNCLKMSAAVILGKELNGPTVLEEPSLL